MNLLTRKPIAKVLAAYGAAVLVPAVIGALEAYAAGDVDWKRLAAMTATGLAAATAAYLRKLTADDVVVIEASRQVDAAG